MTSAAGCMTSIPHMNPVPRTARTRPPRAAIARNASPSHSPSPRTRVSSDRSLSRSSTCSATAATTGPPPNVEPWSPGWIAAAISSDISTAPIGSPPASGFASVIRSGAIPVCSCANSAPVRPRPHCTSSRISAAPCSRVRARNPARNSGASTRTPPSPCTGSAMTAATVPPFSA